MCQRVRGSTELRLRETPPLVAERRSTNFPFCGPAKIRDIT